MKAKVSTKTITHFEDLVFPIVDLLCNVQSLSLVLHLMGLKPTQADGFFAHGSTSDLGAKALMKR